MDCLENGQPKIDINSHIIPFINDGCKSYSELEQAVSEILESNVKEIVCTPSFNLTITNEHVVDYYNYLSDMLSYSNVKTYFGFEFILNCENILLLKQILSNSKFNNFKYLLVEFGDNNIDNNLELIKEVKDLGYTIILAHPEEHAKLRKISLIENLRENGVIIQCNANNFIKGKSDKKSYQFANKLLYRGLVNIVASNCNGEEKYNYNNLNKAFSNISNKTSLECAQYLFYENPKYVIDNYMLSQ